MQEINNSNVHIKKKMLDLLVETKDAIIDIEYNSVFDEEVRKRNYAYICRVYSNTIKKIGKYNSMPKII